MHDQIAAVGGIGRHREVDAERGCDVGPPGVDVDERHADTRETREQTGDAATHHARSDHGDPVAHERRGVPQGVDGRLHRSGEHGALWRHIVRHRDDRSGRYDVRGLMRIQAEDGASL